MILVVIFFGIGLLTAFISIIFYGTSTNYFLDLALILDIFGNVVCQHFFNVLLIKKTSIHKFGIIDYTISKTLGLNQRDETLTRIGILLVKILDLIEKDHCLKCI